jgi:hypothetical protein
LLTDHSSSESAKAEAFGFFLLEESTKETKCQTEEVNRRKKPFEGALFNFLFLLMIGLSSESTNASSCSVLFTAGFT